MSDTLDQWLYRRFGRNAIPWESLGPDDQLYWRHEADAVERATIRGGFKSAEAKPGDTILVGYDHRLSDEEFEEMTSRLRTIGDDLGIRFGVIEGASSVIVVRSDLDVNGAPMRRRETLESDEVPGER